MTNNDMNHDNPYAPPALIVEENVKAHWPGLVLGLCSSLLGIAAITTYILLYMIDTESASILMFLFAFFGIMLGKDALKTGERVFAILGILLSAIVLGIFGWIAIHLVLGWF